MEWLQSVLEGENGSALQLVLITLVLVIILVLLVWIFRRIVSTPARRAARNRVPRLSITDVTAVDDKRFLILARRDNVEHLLLIGGANDLVVETDIVRAQPQQAKNGITKKKPAAATTAPESPVQAKTVAAPTPEPAAEPPVSAPVATAAAGVAAAGAVAANAGEAVVESVAAPIETVVEASEAAAEAAADTTAEAIDSAIEAVESSLTPDILSSTEGEADAAPEIDEIDIEAEISQQLDDAMAVESVQVEAETTEDTSPAEDDMQKLLQELANETKEPA